MVSALLMVIESIYKQLVIKQTTGYKISKSRIQILDFVRYIFYTYNFLSKIPAFSVPDPHHQENQAKINSLFLLCTHVHSGFSHVLVCTYIYNVHG